MEYIGQPFSIQNTSEGWLVSWDDAVVERTDAEILERVSFTVLIPRRAQLSIQEVQTYALKRAAELLQRAIRVFDQ